MQARHRRVGVAVAGLVLAVTASAPSALAQPAPVAPSWQLTANPAPGDAAGIDTAGDIVSATDHDGYLTRADGRMINLSRTVKAPGTIDDLAISHDGHISGVENTGPYGENLGWTWTLAGTPRWVVGYPDVPAGTDPAVRPVDVNDRNELVGSAYDPKVGASVATRWSSVGVPSRVDPAAGTDVQLNSINDAGVAGGSVGRRAALFGPLGAVRLLPTLPGEELAQVGDVSDTGDALGYILTASGSHDVVWHPNGAIQRLGVPSKGAFAHGSTDARAINSRGIVVGSASTRSGTAFEAVAWTPDGTPHVLPAPNGNPRFGSVAEAVNDRGEITGFRRDLLGEYPDHSLVWTERS